MIVDRLSPRRYRSPMSSNQCLMPALIASGAITVLVCAGLASDSWALAGPARARAQSQLSTSGSELYEVACAKCPGRDRWAIH